MKYYCELANSCGCVFNTDSFDSIKKAKEWAKGRGGEYRLNLYDSRNVYDIIHTWKIKNDRFYNVYR